MNEMLRDLYEQMILDHNRNPRNFGPRPEDANHEAHGFNPICNDEVFVYLTIKDGVVEKATFDGCGCAISMASASMMSEQLQGKTVEELEALCAEMRILLTRDERFEGMERLGKLKILQGVRDYPMRVKCATLAWHTLLAALHDKRGTVTTE